MEVHTRASVSWARLSSSPSPVPEATQCSAWSIAQLTTVADAADGGGGTAASNVNMRVGALSVGTALRTAHVGHGVPTCMADIMEEGEQNTGQSCVMLGVL